MSAHNPSDALLLLLADFFNLPRDIEPRDITQQTIAAWDSLAMVQLIADLQGTFKVEFDLDEIEMLRSYDEIQHSLRKKGVCLEKPMAGGSEHGVIVEET